MIFKIEEFIASRKKYNWRSSVLCAVRRYVDHEGNSFESMIQMACHWRITVKLLEMRLYCRYTLEQALTMPRYERRRLQRKEK